MISPAPWGFYTWHQALWWPLELSRTGRTGAVHSHCEVLGAQPPSPELHLRRPPPSPANSARRSPASQVGSGMVCVVLGLGLARRELAGDEQGQPLRLI